MRTRAMLLGAGAIALLGLLAGPAQADGGEIVVASTTSTEQSGLFRHINRVFTEDTGIEVQVVAVGTGQAIEIARRGDADHLFVHDEQAEQAFVEDGYGIERREVMYNDFVIIGPADDPADVAAADDAVDAFRRIAEAEAPFTSRGDDSGTNRSELRLWQLAGVEPAGAWYRELGSGMGPTLNTAAGMDAYVYADRGTWIAFDNRQDLEILFAGDERLFNPYGSVLINPERHPHIAAELAREWHEWLTSDAGQAAIADYELRGEQLFFPNAD